MNKDSNLIGETEQSEDFEAFPELLCRCGHPRIEHEDEKNDYIVIKDMGNHWCRDCALIYSAYNSFHTFQLDNLSYIEFEARKRGLI